MGTFWQAIHEHVANDCPRLFRRILAGGSAAAAQHRATRELALAGLGPWFFEGTAAVLHADPSSPNHTDWHDRIQTLASLGLKPLRTEHSLRLEGDAALEVQAAQEAVLTRLLGRIETAFYRHDGDDLIVPVDQFSGDEFQALLGALETELASLAGSIKAYHTARDGNMEAIFCLGFGNIHLEGRAARMMKASLRAHGMPMSPASSH